MDLLTQWLDESPGSARTLAEESLIVDVAEEIWQALNLAGLSKTDLAKRLNVSKPRITKLLDGSANMTLRTLADIAFELDKKITITLSNKRAAGGWAQKTTISQAKPARLTLVASTFVNVRDNRYHPANEAERDAA